MFIHGKTEIFKKRQTSVNMYSTSSIIGDYFPDASASGCRIAMEMEILSNSCKNKNYE